MKCSRCGCYQPNSSCYVCSEDEQPQAETADDEGGSLLKTNMNPDTARACCAFAFVASIVTMILLAATSSPDFEGYVACAILAVMALFIGLTQDA
jgi:hypothetical protein